MHAKVFARMEAARHKIDSRITLGRSMNLSRKIIGFLIFSLLCLSSCGLNDEKPADADVYDLSNLEGSCELNTDALTDILEKDIKKDIDCLESNLNQFVDFVRRADSNFINRTELSKFIIKFFPESRNIAGDLLKLVFV